MTKNNKKLIQELRHIAPEKRTAHYACDLVLLFPDGREYEAQGVCKGLIRDFYAGKGGFGYDPLFYLPQFGKTMAEITLDEKNQISHRGKALKNSWRCCHEYHLCRYCQ